ncbi:tRNA lysidine(34) synthetase TilS [Urechidicola croceus]|uniref:tRNA(Ile)-lysidine synthase n=1 Tax=Urechidicola croceus TaxID=1850246 RepID=A0A1D8PAK1_9FLAO|nr:tRNA lysidine(34) synthetase TilS [Urechidicola croceus]AOW21565.1 tRNA lysidine(34) synthetase TilS [Urechidicola croceus]
MLKPFQQHIDSKLPFLKDKKLLIAISGGIDSVVLTHLLKLSHYNISLAHCNFNLREKESNLDEKFVKNLAQNLDINYYTISFETEKYAAQNKLSIQMAARELRYEWFEKIRQENNLDYILTAHHKDDVLETFLINFTRGTGLEGLTGIPETNGYVVRPLLNFTREEIEFFAKNNSIKWREDQSNTSTKYFRNKIRHKIIPILKELNSNLMDSFDNTLTNLNESQQIINDKISDLKDKIIITEEGTLKLKIEQIKELSNPKAYLFQLLKGYGFTEWNDISNLLNAQSGKQIQSKTHRVIKDRSYLLLTKLNCDTHNLNYKIDAKTNSFENSEFKLLFKNSKEHLPSNSSNSIVYIDKNLLNYPLNVRKWEKGDYFYPIGLGGKKKLSKFFKDEKMSILEKEKTWLLCTELNEIIWVIGKRLDNRFKITDKTTQTLKITHEKIN